MYLALDEVESVYKSSAVVSSGSETVAGTVVAGTVAGIIAGTGAGTVVIA
jgi:hypothetical protein